MLVTNITYQGLLWEKFCETFGSCNVKRVTPGNPDTLRDALHNADIAILQELLPASDISGKNLKWVHVTHSGIDSIARPEILECGIRLSGSAGYSVEALAEHAMFFMLSLSFRAKELFESQRRSAWEKSGRQDLRCLYKQSVGIIGLGNIGQALATRCKAMQMNVLGYAPNQRPLPKGVNKLYTADEPDGLQKMLVQCDYVVLAVPLTNKTYHLIGAKEIESMKSTAQIINIARGPVIDENALIRALQNNEIAGAGLDVFNTEPLPSDSTLWQMPNVIITPHTSPCEIDRDARAVDLITRNYHNFITDQPLLNELTYENIYTY